MNSKLWIVALDVYKKTIKSPSFIIMILAPIILLILGYMGMEFFTKASSAQKIGIYSQQTQVVQAVKQFKNDDYKFKQVNSIKQAQTEIKNDKLDYYLVLDVKQDKINATLYGEESPGNTLKNSLTLSLTMLQSSLRARSLNLTSQQVASLSEPVIVQNKMIRYDDNGQAKASKDNSDTRFAIGYVACIIAFIIIMTYAQIIAQEIASEKGMRIMEVILSSVKAQTHFYGKLLGVLLSAITQFAILLVLYGGFYLVKRDTLEQLNLNFNFSGFTPGFLGLVIAYVFIGCLLYSVLAALCGSLVNRSEDTAKAIVPVTYLSLIGYLVGLVLGANKPDNILVQICGYVPFLSSFVEPIRLANGVVSPVENICSLGLSIITLIVLTIFSAKMYKSNVLIYNQKGVWAALKDSIALMKNEK